MFGSTDLLCAGSPRRPGDSWEIQFISRETQSLSRQSLSEPVVEFKWLEAKAVGSDVVVFHLEDGATVKVRVSLDRAGVAISTKNPDGTDLYNFSANLQMTVIPPDKKFSIPKSQLQVPQKPKPPDIRQVS